MDKINWLPKFPDNDQIKEVFFQANGMDNTIPDRHVSLFWLNPGPVDLTITQVLQLTGGPSAYFYEIIGKQRDPLSVLTKKHRNAVNEIYSLGSFTRAQRDRIIQLAAGVQFNYSSTVNDCRVWTRDLLEAMVADPVVCLPQVMFDKVDKAAPLVRRQPEA